MTRELLLQYAGPERNSIDSIEELNTDRPGYDTNSFCGLFLQWFHSLVVVNLSLSEFYDKLPDHNKNLYDNKDADIRLKDGVIQKLCELWKSKFNHFLEKFWNNKLFLSLIDEKCPLATVIENTEDGLKFVINSLAESIFEKVFYSIEQLNEVSFNQYPSNDLYKKTVFLMTKNGQLFLFYFYGNNFFRYCETNTS